MGVGRAAGGGGGGGGGGGAPPPGWTGGDDDMEEALRSALEYDRYRNQRGDEGLGGANGAPAAADATNAGIDSFRVHSGDLVCPTDDPVMRGLVNKVSGGDSDVEDDEDDYGSHGPLEEGHARVEWHLAGNERIAEDSDEAMRELVVLDRAFVHGDVVARGTDPLGETGVITGVHLSVELEWAATGERLGPLRASALAHVRAFTPGDYVIHRAQAWLGRIEDAADCITLQFPDGAVCRIKDADPEAVLPAASTEVVDPEECPFYHGMAVRVVSMTVLRRAEWVAGQHSHKRTEGVIIGVEPGAVSVRWMYPANSGGGGGGGAPSADGGDSAAAAGGGARDGEGGGEGDKGEQGGGGEDGASGAGQPPPPVVPGCELLPLSYFSHLGWQLGDFALLRPHVSGPRLAARVELAPPRGARAVSADGGDAHESDAHNGRSRRGRQRAIALAKGLPQAGYVTNTHTTVDVQWQSGEKQLGITSRTLVPRRHLGDHDFWPNEYVVERAEDGEAPAQDGAPPPPPGMNSMPGDAAPPASTVRTVGTPSPSFVQFCHEAMMRAREIGEEPSPSDERGQEVWDSVMSRVLQKHWAGLGRAEREAFGEVAPPASGNGHATDGGGEGEAAQPSKYASRRVGYVDSVDSVQRTALVRWLEPSAVGTANAVTTAPPAEEVSVYELGANSEYSYHVGDIVLRLGGADEAMSSDADSPVRGASSSLSLDPWMISTLSWPSAEADACAAAAAHTPLGSELVSRMRQQLRHASWVGEIIDIKDGNLEVAWANGCVSVMAPEAVHVITRDGDDFMDDHAGESDDDYEDADEYESASEAASDEDRMSHDDSMDSSDFYDSLPAYGDGPHGPKPGAFAFAEIFRDAAAQVVQERMEADRREREAAAQRPRRDTEPIDPTVDKMLVEDGRTQEDVGDAPTIAPHDQVASGAGPSDSARATAADYARFDMVAAFARHTYAERNLHAAPERAFSKRCAKEWAMLQEGLPEGIYVRWSESRLDLVRAAIVGPKKTPYHDGLFLFDIVLPTDYPKAPPEVCYYSFGVRVNPNLYENGKVCLSLLNTWTGKGTETWTPKSSSLLQVLVSIQGLVLNEEPYYNEAGYEKQVGSAEGAKNSALYNESAFLLSLKTYLALMKTPPEHFEKLVQEHFRGVGSKLVAACGRYLNGAVVGSLAPGERAGEDGTGGAADGDVGDATTSSGGFRLMLQKIAPKLEAALAKL